MRIWLWALFNVVCIASLVMWYLTMQAVWMYLATIALVFPTISVAMLYLLRKLEEK